MSASLIAQIVGEILSGSTQRHVTSVDVIGTVDVLVRIATTEQSATPHVLRGKTVGRVPIDDTAVPVPLKKLKLFDERFGLVNGGNWHFDAHAI
jgi:hypothetical protein